MFSSALILVIAAGLIPYIVGLLWYHPRTFGATWMRMKHITPEMVERNTRHTKLTTLAVLLAGFLVSALLALLMQALAIDSVAQACILAAFLWGGCVLPTSLGAVLWDHQPWQLYVIEKGEWLVSMLLMACILTQ